MVWHNAWSFNDIKLYLLKGSLNLGLYQKKIILNIGHVISINDLSALVQQRYKTHPNRHLAAIRVGMLMLKVLPKRRPMSLVT